jgi:TolA-binding protein
MPNNDHPSNSASDSKPQVYVVTEEARGKARKFFEHAKKSAETHNWDYAIKLYVDGLALWPDAVEEGLKQLRVVATARRLNGGKPAGFLAARQRPTTGKDFLKNLNNALFLYGHDPVSVAAMEQLLQNASKAKLIRTVGWIAPVLMDAYNSAKKLPEAHYQSAGDAMNAAADLAMALAEDAVAMEILNAAIATTQIWLRHHPESINAPRARSHASGKLTIVKGKFDKAEGFQESLKDADAQRELLDKAKPTLSGERAAQLIAKARADWEADRESAAKLFALIELMVREEKESLENEAVRLLESEYAATSNYAFKQKADDIRIKQMSRQRRALETRLKSDPANVEWQRAAADFRARQINSEMDILLDRQRQYPSDLRVKFQLAVRYMQAQRYDNAIPLFQMAQSDGRSRLEARLMMGRCFFEKHFHAQAIETLQSTIHETDSTSSPVVLELYYWLGRSFQAAGRPADAQKTYGQLIQLDYNYKDARQRLEALVAGRN